MSKSAPPSRIARSVASSLWPDVQQQKKIAPGTFWFDCAGHGGVVALIDQLTDIDPDHLEAAREYGLIHLVVRVTSYDRSRIFSTAAGYDEATLLRLHSDGAELYEVWVGEEDCDWATLAYCSPTVLAGLQASRTVTLEDVYGCVQRWNEKFLAAITPGYEPLPTGQIREAERNARILAEGGVLLWSAIDVGDKVEAMFRGKGFTRTYLIDHEIYDARVNFPFPFDATPEEFAALGPIEEIGGAEADA